MNKNFILCVVVAITFSVVAASVMEVQLSYSTQDFGKKATGKALAAPVAISEDTVYIAWPSNETGNNEVMFRTSTDGGVSFGDKVNLSNTTEANSTRVEIDSDADSVVVTWWETNQTSDIPVMRVSNDNGETFGPILGLATNGTVGQEAAEE